ncbi:hypothetical protein BOTBODRAFT_51001 [Botryobasidium botryosum FD-172 SS1]|uniref:DUF6699 domain-containing protein n=1 Tax=Botryobasidium botryosum (strain FD-172 SS1) TaxID=930990 RepID=A0A067N1Z2_BOTB1|nr:hypothetical protein BOTBODRAFT_51001 [Botryobasidium botryosum FD-172 SS1]
MSSKPLPFLPYPPSASSDSSDGHSSGTSSHPDLAHLHLRDFIPKDHHHRHPHHHHHHRANSARLPPGIALAAPPSSSGSSSSHRSQRSHGLPIKVVPLDLLPPSHPAYQRAHLPHVQQFQFPIIPPARSNTISHAPATAPAHRVGFASTLESAAATIFEKFQPRRRRASQPSFTISPRLRRGNLEWTCNLASTMPIVHGASERATTAPGSLTIEVVGYPWRIPVRPSARSQRDYVTVGEVLKSVYRFFAEEVTPAEWKAFFSDRELQEARKWKAMREGDRPRSAQPRRVDTLGEYQLFTGLDYSKPGCVKLHLMSSRTGASKRSRSQSMIAS